MTIGEKIKSQREKLNMPQVELAEKVSISKQTLYKYENDIITNIPSDKIEAIASVLNVTPAYLMGWEDNGKTDNKSDNNEDIAKVALFGGDKEVTDEMWDEVKDYIEYIKQKHFKE